MMNVNICEWLKFISDAVIDGIKTFELFLSHNNGIDCSETLFYVFIKFTLVLCVFPCSFQIDQFIDSKLLNNG